MSKSALSQLAHLASLEAGWDGHRANAISPAILSRAEDTLRHLAEEGLPEPWPVPTTVGGINLEWHTERRDIELELMPEEAVEILATGCTDSEAETLAATLASFLDSWETPATPPLKSKGPGAPCQ